MIKTASNKSAKRRVALLTMPPGGTGGTHTLVEFLYRLFQKRLGLEPYVLCHVDRRVVAEASLCWQRMRRVFPQLWRPRVGVRLLEHNGRRVVGVGAFLPEWEPMRYVSSRKWRELLADFDMIIVVGGSILAGLPAAVSGRKYVVWVGTPYWEDRAERLRTSGLLRRCNFLITKPILDAIERTVALQASIVMVQSRYTAEIFRQRYHIPEERMSYISCPVADGLFRPRQSSSESGRCVRLVSIGRFTDPRKNLPLLMEAFHLVQQECDTIRLTVVGSYDENEVERLKQKFPGATRARFLGQVSDERKRDELWSSDIFVLSSEQEGLGIVLLEAMAAGLPVISTDCGGPRSIIQNGKNGLVVPNHDAKSLANAIVGLANSPHLCRSMGEEGQCLAREQHSERAVGSKILEILDHVYAC